MEKMDKKVDDIITNLTKKFQKELEANKNEIEQFKEDVMEVKPNLEIMENIVGQKKVSMEHQLKSELEKSVECIEDRMESKMKKFVQIIKNTATMGSCYVRDVGPHL